MPSRVLVAILLAVAVVTAGIAATALLLPRSRAATQSSVPDRGSALALRGLAGFDVTVSDVHVPDGAGLVTLSVSFRNTSRSQQRADPQDFTFRDASGATVGPVFDPPCPRWMRADLHPAGEAGQRPRDADARQVGPDFGPVPLCFPVSRAATDGPTLVWNPDVGLFATPVAIPLR